MNCPLITEDVLDLRAVKEKGFDPGAFYIKLVEYKEMICRIFHFILDNLDGCILFHCQAGKDTFREKPIQEVRLFLLLFRKFRKEIWLWEL